MTEYAATMQRLPGLNDREWRRKLHAVYMYILNLANGDAPGGCEANPGASGAQSETGHRVHDTANPAATQVENEPGNP